MNICNVEIQMCSNMGLSIYASDYSSDREICYIRPEHIELLTEFSYS
jgi:hypothetical protein